MYRTKTLARSVLAVGLVAPALGFAASDETIIEQIIVTAQKRATALQDVPFSVAALTARSRSATRARPTSSTWRATSPASHHRPRSRPEPGRDPRHQRRPGRARPGGGVKESVGVYLDESPISHGAVHAGSRPVRPRAHRSAARPAGHAVRRRLLVGHGALHHARSRSSGSSKARSKLALQRGTDGEFGGTCAAASTCRSARPRRCASSATTTSCRASSTPCIRAAQCAKT